MKVRLTFKTPDVEDQLDPDERAEAEGVMSKFIQWSEYITVEFDTVSNTAIVVEL